KSEAALIQLQQARQNAIAAKGVQPDAQAEFAEIFLTRYRSALGGDKGKDLVRFGQREKITSSYGQSYFVYQVTESSEGRAEFDSLIQEMEQERRQFVYSVE